ncbi:uncharacterized protein K444DRAFT_689417, partial [Hyaloscypha bicolor E]
TNAKPKPSLPHPEKFNGQVHKFNTWLPSIQAKLRVNCEAISDATAQFYYIYLNLESYVQAMMQEAEDKLYSLKQGTNSLHAFIAKFERILYEARRQD